MEEAFVLQKPFGDSGRVELTFTDGDLRYEDEHAVHRYGRADDRDGLLKIAVSSAGTRLLRREADAYGRISGTHTAFGRLLGFRTAEDPACLIVTRRGIPVSRCEPGMRLEPAQLTRAARDLFGALDALADLGFAHRAVSADSVFWDGLHVELQSFGHVRLLGPAGGLPGSALGSPTGVAVSDDPDVRAAARLLHRLATGRPGGGPAEAMVREIAEIDPELAHALEPALGDRPPPPKEMVVRLRRGGPRSPSAQPPRPRPPSVRPEPRQEAATAPRDQDPPDQERRRTGDHPHRMEFRELRRQQREFRQRQAAAARQQRTQWPRPDRSAEPPGSGRSRPGGDSALWLLVAVIAVVIAVLNVVLVVLM